jgi:uncharacterized protein
MLYIEYILGSMVWFHSQEITDFGDAMQNQIKAPKIYIRDSGLLHSLLSIAGHFDLLGHPRLGASWEGFALEQILNVIRPREAYFWATHGGAELDLLFLSGGKR